MKEVSVTGENEHGGPSRPAVGDVYGGKGWRRQAILMSIFQADLNDFNGLMNTVLLYRIWILRNSAPSSVITSEAKQSSQS
jgi:hypothetical protein